MIVYIKRTKNTMTRPKSTLQSMGKRYFLILIIGSVSIILAGQTWLWFKRDSMTRTVIKIPNHIIPYVDGEEATQHVQSFYEQYIKTADQNRRKLLVSMSGSKNLVFYNDYYKHGFDPITCSSVSVKIITASLISTGPVAHIAAKIDYVDGSASEIKASVVLNDDGLKLDSITCPGDKANLPPSSL